MNFIELTTTCGMSKQPTPVSVNLANVSSFYPLGNGTRLNFGETVQDGSIFVLESYATVLAILRESNGQFDDDDTQEFETETAA
jgi:hypothetical protein